MKTRAEHILSLLGLVHEDGREAALYIAAGGLGGLASMNIASGMSRARRETQAKIHQAGLGKEHQKAKEQLSNMRKKHLKTFGSNSGLSLRIQAQKRKIQDIENRGLERYHKGLIVNPPSSSSEQKQG